MKTVRIQWQEKLLTQTKTPDNGSEWEDGVPKAAESEERRKKHQFWLKLPWKLHNSMFKNCQ